MKNMIWKDVEELQVPNRPESHDLLSTTETWEEDRLHTIDKTLAHHSHRKEKGTHTQRRSSNKDIIHTRERERWSWTSWRTKILIYNVWRGGTGSQWKERGPRMADGPTPLLVCYCFHEVLWSEEIFKKHVYLAVSLQKPEVKLAKAAASLQKGGLAHVLCRLR